MNKWDTIPNKNQQTATYYEQDVREKLRILHWAPIVYSTAIAGHNVDKYVLPWPSLLFHAVQLIIFKSKCFLLKHQLFVSHDFGI